MKIVMLDMDGVINSDQFYNDWFKERGFNEKSSLEFRQLFYSHDGYSGFVVPALRDRLNDIFESTDCKIVWSSAWRVGCTLDDARALFKAKGLPHERLIGMTPDFNSNTVCYTPRCVEIAYWLKSHPEVSRCAVVDDDDGAGLELPSCCRFFQTDWDCGITEEIANNLKEYLV